MTSCKKLRDPAQIVLVKLLPCIPPPLPGKEYVTVKVNFFLKTGKAYPLLQTKHFWGTRQQLRAGKVIADWVDPINGPIDPVFGVLLCPTAGIQDFIKFVYYLAKLL